MTREEEAIEEIQKFIGWFKTDSRIYKALKAAIQALSQEPCDDAVSRQAVLDGIEELKKSPWATDKRGNGFEYLITEALDVVADLCVKQLSPVTHKSGKWDRLYSWLNDMRLSIAPDETVTDIDERNCRESQTDILDEIMEWMIKAEVEPQERSKE